MAVMMAEEGRSSEQVVKCMFVLGLGVELGIRTLQAG